MNRVLADPPAAGADKREAVLSAALRLIARSGLHNTPMSAIAREAGVGAGTIYLYFPSKEALINALYLELLQDRLAAVPAPLDPDLAPREHLWRSWYSLARWHLQHRDASNFIEQCEASSILTEETRAQREEMVAPGKESYANSIRKGQVRELPLHVFLALFSGPVLVLAHMADNQKIEVDDETLELTFDCVARAILRPEALEDDR